MKPTNKHIFSPLAAKTVKELLLLLCLMGLVSCQSSDPGTPFNRMDEIRQRGTLLVGATGDYRPLSYLDPQTNNYWGFDADFAEIIGKGLGVKVEFVPTSWPTLTEDMLNEELFDIALCGITITDARKEIMLMSEGYLHNGKTILCRKEQANRYQSIDDINQPDVKVMVNPGGLNEKFAHEHLSNSQIVVHPKNEEIPSLIAEGKADIMITEIVEATYYAQNDERLVAPLLDQPFTHSLMGVLMRKGDEELLRHVNNTIHSCKKDGTLKRLHEKYGFTYEW